MSITVLVLTKNEATNIDECLRSGLFADELLVIDSGSSDETIAIATSLGARVIVKPMDDGFAEQRNFAISQAKTE
ncbi:MAG TPA: glycosyltransferase, partial [Bacillota bacterium]|nr:glycosyltransferase [Bacillota bacterium]